MGGRRTLPDFAADLAARAGDRTAIVYGENAYGYADLAERSARVAAGLAGLGVGPGDRVALWLPNAPAWFELLFACSRLGAIVVAVNTRFRSVEVEDIVGRSGAKVMVMWPGFKGIDFPGILAEVDPAELTSLETVVLYEDEVGGGGIAGAEIDGRRTIGYDALVAAAPLADDHAEPDAGCIVFTTSGTTSKPKFVLHPQRSLVDHARAVAPALGYDAGDAVLLQALPLAGTFGLAQAMATLAGLSPMILMPTFEAEPAAALVQSHDVTHMNGSDEMYLRMLEARPDQAIPFPSLRRCGFAAFNTDPLEVVKTGDAHGLPLCGAYGMSEVQALYALRDPADPPEDRMRGGGKPVSPDAEVRCRDPETGVLLGPGEQGELEIRGPSMMLGYYGNEEATAATLTQDGFVRTGDLGYVEAGGGFTYLSRMGDSLRLGGYLVAPEEISNHLEAHATVSGAQVVGVAGERGTNAVGFVIIKNGAAFSEGALQAHCAAGLARFKVPVRIFEVETFPVTESANGVKVQRNKLRDMANSLVAAG